MVHIYGEAKGRQRLQGHTDKSAVALTQRHHSDFFNRLCEPGTNAPHRGRPGNPASDSGCYQAVGWWFEGAHNPPGD